MERRKYNNSPVDEAICEIRLIPSASFDFTTPARFYEAIRENYPLNPEYQQFLSADTQSQAVGAQVQVRPEAGKVLFPSRDRTRFVGLGNNLLSIHALRPYPGWEAFRDMIFVAVSTYCQVSPSTSVARIAVRYVNKFQVPSANRVSEYLNITPNLSAQIPVVVSGIVLRLQAKFEHVEPPIQTIITVATPDPVLDRELQVVFDIDLHQEWSTNSPELSEVPDIADLLKTKEREVFESLVSDKARELFNVQ